MIYLVDIDQTIANTPEIDGVRDYKNSTPILCRIQKLNKLYDEGHIINYWTSRGNSTGIDWSEFTLQQLKSWGCKFNTVKCGKPSYDFFICDKAMSDKEFFSEK